MHHKLLQKGNLGNLNFPILHLEISLESESVGFKLFIRALGLLKFLWLPKNVRTPKYSYLQALLTFCSSDKSLFLFKLKLFILNTSFFTFYVILSVNTYDHMHGYNYGRSTDLLSQAHTHTHIYNIYVYI